MRIMPYRTHDNAIDGVVINFIDITTMKNWRSPCKRRKLRHEKARELAEGIIATSSGAAPRPRCQFQGDQS